jgi:hypothetical protein
MSDDAGFRSLSAFLGAAVPAGVTAVVMLAAFLVLRNYLPDCYEPKRERARLAKKV